MPVRPKNKGTWGVNNTIVIFIVKEVIFKVTEQAG